MERINEIRQLPSPPTNCNYYERSLPPRPPTEDYTDESSLYTVDDDHSTLVPSAATSILEYNLNGSTRAAPPRHDSLYITPDGSHGASQLDHITPLSAPPIRPRRDIPKPEPEDRKSVV